MLQYHRIRMWKCRTANEVGAGRMKEAKHAAAVAVRLAAFIASGLGVSILLSRTQLVRVYTGDRALLQVCSSSCVQPGWACPLGF